MPSETSQFSTEAAILGRLIDPDTPTLGKEAARALIQLDFQPADQQRMRELSAKAASGTLSPAERAEAESYDHVGHLLALLQSKARLSLKKTAESS